MCTFGFVGAFLDVGNSACVDFVAAFFDCFGASCFLIAIFIIAMAIEFQYHSQN